MSTLLLCEITVFVVILGLLLWKIWNSNWMETADKIGATFASVMFGAIAFFLFVFMLLNSLILTEIFKQGEEKCYHQNIVSLEKTSSAVGDFILGSGYIGEVRHYFYFFKRNDGGFKEDSVAVRNAIIYEINDGCSPKVQWDVDLWTIPEWMHGCSLSGNSWSRRTSSYRIYVPAGTIVKEFKL